MKHLKWKLLFLSLVYLSSMAFAQKEGGQKEFGITLGINSGYFKDLNFSSLNYRQSGPVFGLNYRKIKEKTQFGVQLEFNANKVKTDIAEQFTSDFYIGNLQAEWLRRINETDKKIQWHIGGQFLSNNNFLIFEGLNSFTYNFAHSLGVKGMVEYQLGPKASIQSSLALPLVTWMVRPPYNGFDKTTEANGDNPLNLVTKEGKLTSVNDYLLLQWNTQFRYKASDRLDFGFNYNLTFQKVSGSTPLTQLQNQFSVSTIFKF